MVKRIGKLHLDTLIVCTDEAFVIESLSGQFNDRILQSKFEVGAPLSKILSDYLTVDEINNLFSELKRYPLLSIELETLKVTISHIVYDEANHYLFIFKRIAQDNLESLAQDYLANVIRYSPGFIYLKDPQFRYILCNENFAKAAGLDASEDIKGKTDFELVWANTQADSFRQSDIEALSGKSKINFEESQLQADGTTKMVLANKVPLYNSKNTIIGILGNYLDITEQKKLEQDLIEAKATSDAASQAKTEFLENMRHDIRTPLTGIVGFSHLLKMESDNPLIKEYSENLVASSSALLDLLDEVLEAIRVSSGEIPKLKKKFHLEKTLNQVIELNRVRALEKKLSLTLKIDRSLPKYVIGDKVRLHRVTLELIANALNFTDFGFVKLNALLAKKDKRKLVLKLTVEDSGIGIPKDKQQEIYVQFKRLTPSYQGIYKGAGLGLSVVKQFIDELGGEIYVESEVRHGTIFTCLIPLQEPFLDDDTGIDDAMDQIVDTPLETTYSQEVKPTVETKQQYPFRVLVVEDNPIAQTISKSILAQLRCDADIAGTGETALELWKNNQYHLIFMDIGLPDMNGYEVTHQIRVHELTKKTHSPIIGLTAHANDENKQRCIEAGMNAVITKPLSTKSCTDILEAFIPVYHQRQNLSQSTAYRSELPPQNVSLLDLSAYPILDVEEGIKTIGTTKVLAEMLTFLIQDSLPSDVQLMKQAHDAADWDKIQQLAHKIKGGAVYVGTIRIKMACQYLERYWKSGQYKLLEPLYQQAITVIDESIKEINHWLKSR